MITSDVCYIAVELLELDSIFAGRRIFDHAISALPWVPSNNGPTNLGKGGERLWEAQRESLFEGYVKKKSKRRTWDGATTAHNINWLSGFRCTCTRFLCSLVGC